MRAANLHLYNDKAVTMAGCSGGRNVQRLGKSAPSDRASEAQQTIRRAHNFQITGVLQKKEAAPEGAASNL